MIEYQVDPAMNRRHITFRYKINVKKKKKNNM